MGNLPTLFVDTQMGYPSVDEQLIYRSTEGADISANGSDWQMGSIYTTK